MSVAAEASAAETPDTGQPDSGATEFEEDEHPQGGEAIASGLLLDLDGFEGPIDILLTLARDQKVDLTKISILQLADQYLTFMLAEEE